MGYYSKQELILQHILLEDAKPRLTDFSASRG